MTEGTKGSTRMNTPLEVTLAPLALVVEGEPVRRDSNLSMSYLALERIATGYARSEVLRLAGEIRNQFAADLIEIIEAGSHRAGADALAAGLAYELVRQSVRAELTAPATLDVHILSAPPAPETMNVRIVETPPPAPLNVRILEAPLDPPKRTRVTRRDQQGRVDETVTAPDLPGVA